ncbi:hypothetical protein DFP72DRAFT_1175148 [Ephemerocybe angulata]|uniref:F-box domain-containing protein n=1 Tax=Ephemerocybe angulata TaxID=980116 RepID=A0A8H6HHM1_9AGAR|nr:hypothetical protein DFP72DRAFT_1175148 [Tulosesus angulatus]
MAHTNPLPIELTDRIPQEIFDHVATFADAVSLKSLSLVSHLWEASTRHLLFYEFQFNGRFLSCFSENPKGWQRILPCIQRAHIAVYCGIPGEAALKEALSAALPRMVKLSRLRFRRSSSGTVALLIALLKGSEQITGLELRELLDSFDSFQVLQETIASLPGLEDLLVQGIWWRKDRGHKQGSVQAMVTVPRKIRRFTAEDMVYAEDLDYAGGTSHILQWLAQGSDSIRFMSVEEVDGSNVLSKFTRVETLILGKYSYSPLPGLTLSAFKALKSLEFGYLVTLDDTGYDIHPSWCPDLLSSVASTLSYLTFVLAFEEEDDLERMDWMTLNCLLQNSPFYADLRGIVIGIRRPRGAHTLVPSRDDCDRMIRRRVPGLRPGTRLTVKFYVGGQSSSFIYD